MIIVSDPARTIELTSKLLLAIGEEEENTQ